MRKLQAKLVFEDGRIVLMYDVHGLLRGDPCVLVSEKTLVSLESIYIAFREAAGEIITRGAIVELAIDDLCRKMKEEGLVNPPIRAHLSKRN